MKTRFFFPLGIFAAMLTGQSGRTQTVQTDTAEAELFARLRNYPHKIVHERFEEGNWELYLINADGSDARNLTSSAGIDEIYPKASPDGGMVAFEQYEETGCPEKLRSVFVMNRDGSGRIKVADHGRQPCWSPDGATLAFMMGPDHPAGYSEDDGLMFYSAAEGTLRRHPNPELKNMINLSYTADGKWIVATVVAAMGYTQSIMAVEAAGDRVVNLIHQTTEVTPDYWGCRPDVSPDGRQIAWSVEKRDASMWIAVADLVEADGVLKAVNRRYVAQTDSPREAYHADWSPDGRYIVFSSGPKAGRLETARYRVLSQAPGWDLHAVEVAQPNVVVQLTHNGMGNKEADWLPAQ